MDRFFVEGKPIGGERDAAPLDGTAIGEGKRKPSYYPSAYARPFQGREVFLGRH